MKRFLSKFAQFCALLLFAVCTATVLFPGVDALALDLTGVSPSVLVDSLTLYTVDGVLFAAGSGWLAKVASDPQTWHKWSQIAIKIGENKTEFKESDIGMSWGDDGPLDSQQVAASPIKWARDLEQGGKYMDVKIEKPLFTDPSDILNEARYKTQQKAGAEYKLERQNFRCPVDLYNLPIGETDIEDGLQNTAHETNGSLMKRLVDAMTDNEAQRKDFGLWFAAFAGYDIHHFIGACIDAGTSNGAEPTFSTAAGMMSAPTEHRETYVWYDDKLNKVTYNSTIDTYEDNIITEINKVQADDKPSLKLFKLINRMCVDSQMIPALIRHEGTLKEFYLVYVPGDVRDLAEDDDAFKSVMNNAYNGQMKKSPLINDDDVVYKNLIIRSSTKLNKTDYFTMKNSFNAIGTAATDTTKMTFNKQTVNGVEKLSITPGVRQFTTDSDAFDAFGQANTNVLKRIFVCGAAGLVRATGKQHEMRYKKEDDFGTNPAVNKPCIFGHARVESWNTDNTYDSTYQSFQVVTLGAYV